MKTNLSCSYQQFGVSLGLLYCPRDDESTVHNFESERITECSCTVLKFDAKRGTRVLTSALSTRVRFRGEITVGLGGLLVCIGQAQI